TAPFTACRRTRCLFLLAQRFACRRTMARPVVAGTFWAARKLRLVRPGGARQVYLCPLGFGLSAMAWPPSGIAGLVPGLVGAGLWFVSLSSEVAHLCRTANRT